MLANVFIIMTAGYLSTSVAVLERAYSVARPLAILVRFQYDFVY